MTSDAYFRGASGTRYTYTDIANRIRQEAPQTLGKHIFVQLKAIGLLEEMQRGTTPRALPFTFAEASYTPVPWDCDGYTIGISTEALEGGIIRQVLEALERLAYDAGGDQNNPLIRDKTLESIERARAATARAKARIPTMTKQKNITFKVWLDIERYDDETGQGEDMDAPASSLAAFGTYQEARDYAERVSRLAECINL